MLNVFVKIGEAQQQLKDAVLQGVIRSGGVFDEHLDDSGSLGEQPREALAIYGLAAGATFQGAARFGECDVHEVRQAELLAAKRRHRVFIASRDPAVAGMTGLHRNTPAEILAIN